MNEEINSRVELKHLNNENTNWKRGFFTITAGQAVSMIGSGAVQFALIWWLTNESNSSLILSIAGLFAFLPQAILGPFAGVWVDRLNRKTVMIFADLFMGLVATLLSIAFLFGNPPYWMACVVLGIRAVGSVFHTPAAQATIPMLVPKDQLLKANSVSEFLQTGSSLLSPILGAALFAILPMHIILLTDLIGAIVASLTVAITKIPKLPPKDNSEKPNFISELKEGAKCYTRDKKLFSYTIIFFICMMFYMPLGMLFPLMVSDTFHGGEWYAGAAQTLYTLGMMAIAIILGTAASKLKNKLNASKIGLLLFAVALFIGGILPHNMLGLWLFILTCFFMGVGVNLSTIPYVAYIQESMPKDMHGRVLSLFYTIVSAAMPLGLMFAGPISNLLGLPLWFIIAGIGMPCIIFIFDCVLKK
ncbi:MFS transporter, DHA3 family, macrolide efflux protein [Clostridium sp. DSM 8431]|uniref:MFS transporter n=1 Tax=Clostridium sp. DSM 8431 TaxID=1761781 RepID=UPI0008DED190|nr:MFS transporter [Clostridium sp. DSM 8431]SFU55660.1 MFS transporter, DHA3 family, macrolide efflux protein [Clostridium sp. DSM 8431]